MGSIYYVKNEGCLLEVFIMLLFNQTLSLYVTGFPYETSIIQMTGFWLAEQLSTFEINIWIKDKNSLLIKSPFVQQTIKDCTNLNFLKTALVCYSDLHWFGKSY